MARKDYIFAGLGGVNSPPKSTRNNWSINTRQKKSDPISPEEEAKKKEIKEAGERRKIIIQEANKLYESGIIRTDEIINELVKKGIIPESWIGSIEEDGTAHLKDPTHRTFIDSEKIPRDYRDKVYAMQSQISYMYENGATPEEMMQIIMDRKLIPHYYLEENKLTKTGVKFMSAFIAEKIEKLEREQEERDEIFGEGDPR